MTPTLDPKGYYAILGVSPGAPLSDIKTAFRRRAIELHPDRNKASDASSTFQHLHEAYTVLSDPSSRAQYDTDQFEAPPQSPARGEAAPTSPAEPIACSVCGKVTAQPRYVILFEVKSIVVMTFRTPIQGIFCAWCSARKAVRATLVTWALGWWGFPWGIIYSVHALFRNILGGIRPAETNIRLAGYQAWWFAQSGNIPFARAIAFDALELGSRHRSQLETSDAGRQLLAGISALVTALEDGTPLRKLKNRWSLWSWSFVAQAAIPAVILGLLAFNAIPESIPPSQQGLPRPDASPALITQLPDPVPRKKAPSSSPKPTARAASAMFVRPATAPNGRPWPTRPSYVAGFVKSFTNGHSTLTIDNSQNESDVFTKLFSIDGASPVLTRVFFIPGKGRFTLTDLTPGNYDLRYRDLVSGYLSRSEPLSLEETEMEGGVRFTEMSVTLYKVRGGNMRTYALAEDDFE